MNKKIYNLDETEKNINEINNFRNESNTVDLDYKICPTLYRIPMVCAFELFALLNNSSNFEGQTKLYPKGNYSKKIKLFF